METIQYNVFTALKGHIIQYIYENPPNTESQSSLLFSQQMQLTIQFDFFLAGLAWKTEMGQSEKILAIIMCGKAQVQLDWRKHSDLWH